MRGEEELKRKDREEVWGYKPRRNLQKKKDQEKEMRLSTVIIKL